MTEYLKEEEQDEVKIGGLPILTEEDIIYLTKNYIYKLKDENAEKEKVLQKLDKYLSNFDVKKFMKNMQNWQI